MQPKEGIDFGGVTADYEELRMTAVLLWKRQLQHTRAWDNKNVKVCRQTLEAATFRGGAVGALEHSVNMLVDKGWNGTKVIQ